MTASPFPIGPSTGGDPRLGGGNALTAGIGGAGNVYVVSMEITFIPENL